MRRLLALVALALPLAAGAQIRPAVVPVFHGLLDVRPAGGPFDPVTGEATLRVPRWRFRMSTDSNGIVPEAEELLIALAENQYVLPPGSMRVSRNGKRYSYRAPRGTTAPAIKRFRLQRRKDGTYSARFTLTGLLLVDLVVQDPLCVPMAVIIGDDDFFSGVELVRPGAFLTSRRFAIPRDCEIGNDWPWL